MEEYNMLEKRGVSPVIGSVLLILVALLAIGLIVSIVIPMVRENLEKGKGCFELREYVRIIDSEYTYYNSTNTSLMIERGMENYTIDGFSVSIYSEGKSKRYDLKQGNFPAGVTMLNGNIEIPKPGEARTYIFDISGDKVELAVMSERRMCDSMSYNIPHISELP